MREPRYEYDNFKVDPPKVDDGWYLVKDGMTYRVDVPINKMRFTKSINILTGEVHYQSNADRIRSMSDEKLAELMHDTAWDGRKTVEDPEAFKTVEEWLDWLREEADHD